MIRIERTGVQTPTDLVEADGPGERELARAVVALQAHRDGGLPDGEWSFEFNAYRRSGVKSALTALFKGKCAYCETRYAATQPMDVEHWRPKGQVDAGDGPIKPGYYWLAADWDNLLPSCIDCNRRRTHHDVETATDVKLGKMDQFPLVDPSTRAMTSGDEAAEQPVLINPCIDDPAEFFAYDDNAVMRATGTDGSMKRTRAKESIRVYALNRSGLVQNRRETLALAKLSVSIVKQLSELLVDPNRSENFRIVIDEMIASELASLARRCGDDRPYALMVRQFVEGELTEHRHALTEVRNELMADQD